MQSISVAGQLDDDLGRNTAHGYPGNHREDQRESFVVLASVAYHALMVRGA